MTTKVTGSVLADTAVSAGTYGGTQTLQAFTVDAQGRITYAANITSGVITAGTRGQGADIIVPTIQYNALGQIVAATNTTIRTATTSVTGVVQLADSVSNTSTTAAATPNSVTNTYNHAGLAFNKANSASGVAASAFGQANLSFNTANSASGVAASAFGQANLAYSTANTANSTLNASNLSSGTVPSARISGSYTSITGVGTLAAGSIPTSLITGLASSATTDTTSASNISSGTLPSARISGSYTGITGVGTLTSGSLASLAEFTSSLVSSGYQKLPGGLIIQWGTTEAASAASGTATTITFPLAFATACLGAYPSLNNASNGAAIVGTSTLMTSAISTTQFTVNRGNSANQDSFKTIKWFAIGY